MNVWQMMLFPDLEKHRNNNTVEHVDGWNGKPIRLQFPGVFQYAPAFLRADLIPFTAE